MNFVFKGAFSAEESVSYKPVFVGWRRERDPRWLWLRHRLVPILEWPTYKIVLSQTDYTPTNPVWKSTDDTPKDEKGV